MAAERTLIVNADDFGFSHGLNRGVCRAHATGLVTCASLIANAPNAAQAVEMAASHGLELGIHLNLTSGHPLASGVPSLTVADGRLARLDLQLTRLTAGYCRPAELERELVAQIEHALGLGVQPSHLNSHHHVHAHPALQAIVLKLAGLYSIPAVRVPLELALPRRPADLGRAVALWPFALLLRHRLRRSGVHSSDHFRGLGLGWAFTASRLERALRRLPMGVTELMCHPAETDGELALVTSYVHGRAQELEALTDPRLLKLVESLGIRRAPWSVVGGSMGRQAVDPDPQGRDP